MHWPLSHTGPDTSSDFLNLETLNVVVYGNTALGYDPYILYFLSHILYQNATAGIDWSSVMY